MKKYIKPEIDWEEMLEDGDILLITSPQNAMPQDDDEDNQFSKERQAVDFSDSESIW